MPADVGPEVAALEQMTVAELRLRYAQVFGEPTRTGHKTWLIKRIAWRLQALAEGDLSERARRRAAELANDADLRLSPPKGKRSPRDQRLSALIQDKPDDRLPPPGSVLARSYKGRMVHVRVLSDGFEYEGTLYTSLSAVAKAVTGSHCNGFLFFRLARPGEQPSYLSRHSALFCASSRHLRHPSSGLDTGGESRDFFVFSALPRHVVTSQTVYCAQSVQADTAVPLLYQTQLS